VLSLGSITVPEPRYYDAKALDCQLCLVQMEKQVKRAFDSCLRYA